MQSVATNLHTYLTYIAAVQPLQENIAILYIVMKTKEFYYLRIINIFFL